MISPRAERRRLTAWLADGVRRGVATAWGANLTGSAAMVSYSAVLALVPIALLALFVASILLRSPVVEQTVIDAVRGSLPAPVRDGVLQAVQGVRSSGAGLGIGALVSGVWISISFWSALDNAFRQIYALPQRGWVEQKRFGLRMLLLGVLLVLPTLALPAVRGIARTGLDALPLGVGGSAALRLLLSTGGSWLLLGLVLCAIYRLVPNGRVPWRGVWPGAALAASIILLAAGVFPLYLDAATVLASAGAAVGFLLVLLVWVYVMVIALLLGAVVNATLVRLGRAPAPGPSRLVAAGVARPIDEPGAADGERTAGREAAADDEAEEADDAAATPDPGDAPAYGDRRGPDRTPDAPAAAAGAREPAAPEAAPRLRVVGGGAGPGAGDA